MKNAILEKFNNLYKGCTLYAVHLDGFSHEVFYKDGKGVRHVDAYSAYCPEQYRPYAEAYNRKGEMAVTSFNEDKTKVLFLTSGCGGHCAYQGNAVEYVYKDVKAW